MRNVFAFVATTAIIAFWSTEALPYSYAEAEDPTSVIFRSALLAAKKGDWREVEKLADEGVHSFKEHIFEAEGLSPKFNKAIDEKNISKMAETFANLAYISIRNKLHSNIKENFANYKTSKSKLFMARKTYLDILDGNVKKHDPQRSDEILKQFNAALKGIGNPGLFGIGKIEPDIKTYKLAVKTIEGLIEKSFPSFK